MTDFVEWHPKHHGHAPLHWKPGMPASLDGKNFVRQQAWAWIHGTTYYVPYEAVYDQPRLVSREQVEREIAAWLRGNIDGDCPCQACFMHGSIADAIENGDYKSEQSND